MCDAVLCRFVKSANVFLPGKILGMTELGLEVKNTATGDVRVFDSPEAGAFQPSELDVVLDVVPSGKLVNIGCPVLVPDINAATEGAFVQCRIVDKEYKPLRAKVAYSDGAQPAWFARDDMRVMQSPWIHPEVSFCGNDSELDDAACEDPVMAAPVQRKSKKRLSPPAKKYKKGDIVRMPHGVLKKVS